MTALEGSFDRAAVTVEGMALATSGLAVTFDPSAGVLPYSNATVVAAPSGSTDPDTVAVELETALAPPVLAVGASCSATLPIAAGVPPSVNHRFPSGPATIWSVSLPLLLVLLVNSVITPAGETRATDRLTGGLSDWATHRLPSAPTVMSSGRLVLRPLLNSLIVPVGVIRPIARWVASWSANHTFPSGPAVRESGWLPGCRPMVNSLIVPSGVTCPTAGIPSSVNHTFPSAPAVI